MASLLELIRDFLKESIEGNQAAGDPPVPGKLDDIADIKNKLTSIQLDADQQWHHELARRADGAISAMCRCATRSSFGHCSFARRGWPRRSPSQG